MPAIVERLVAAQEPLCAPLCLCVSSVVNCGYVAISIVAFGRFQEKTNVSGTVLWRADP